MCELQDNIDEAAEQIAWMKGVIEDWRVILADLRRAGYWTVYAEHTIDALIGTLKTLELYNLCLHEEIRKRDNQRRWISMTLTDT